ncbi:MAG: hypothetical protein C0478_00690 [Planctomyces sp.]|nr:hypothetical protein [Planctomyces sp.]
MFGPFSVGQRKKIRQGGIQGVRRQVVIFRGKPEKCFKNRCAVLMCRFEAFVLLEAQESTFLGGITCGAVFRPLFSKTTEQPISLVVHMAQLAVRTDSLPSRE